MFGERVRVRLGAELVQQFVEPSMSVNTRVTVPVGRSVLLTSSMMPTRSGADREERLFPCPPPG